MTGGPERWAFLGGVILSVALVHRFVGAEAAYVAGLLLVAAAWLWTR